MKKKKDWLETGEYIFTVRRPFCKQRFFNFRQNSMRQVCIKSAFLIINVLASLLMISLLLQDLSACQLFSCDFYLFISFCTLFHTSFVFFVKFSTYQYCCNLINSIMELESYRFFAITASFSFCVHNLHFSHLIEKGYGKV